MRPQASLEHISCLLYKCRKLNQRQCAVHLHAHMHQCGTTAHLALGNHLVSTLAEVRSMQLAQHVFDNLVHGNEQAWNSLITGYLKCGLPKHAVNTYQAMQEENIIHPGKHTFVALLKACLNSNDFSTCICINTEIARWGLLERDLLVGNTLVAVYTGFGLLTRAHELADKLPRRDVTTWNVLIAAYAKLGLAVEVLDCLDQMLLEGISPESVTFSCCLRACGTLDDKRRGERLHDMIKQKGFLEGDHVVGSSLVAMYCKWGFLTNARQVFDKLPIKDVVSWTILIQGYADHGYGEEALQCFEHMQALAIFPDPFMLACSLKACVNIGAADKGQGIHLEIAKRGLVEGDQVIGNLLVDLYSKCNLLADAQQVFDMLPVKDSVSCNALLAGYAEHGYDEQAIKLFNQMPADGVVPDAIAYVCLIKACGRTGDLNKGRALHADIERTGLMQKDPAVGNMIVDMYMRCGFSATAQEVFEKLPFRDIVTWTILLAGYAEHGHVNEALDCFEQMRILGFSPDAVALICSLQACNKLRASEMGHCLHAEIEKKGLLDRNLEVGNTLVNMYAKFGSLSKAKQVFDSVPARDIVSWNILISGYAECGRGEEGFFCLQKMEHEGVFLDKATAMSLLKACGIVGASERGRELHAEIERQSFLGKCLILSNAVVNMYASCGMLSEARQVFEGLAARDVISWTILITKYADFGYREEALTYFEQMQGQGVSPDPVAYICILSVCVNAGALQKGRDVHAEIERIVTLRRNSFIGNTLVHMYAQHGLLADAQEVFDKLCIHDVASWNVLIAGYARFGGPRFLFVLGQMLKGVTPNLVTCRIVLNACCQVGFSDGRQLCFEARINDPSTSAAIAFCILTMNVMGLTNANKAGLMLKERLPFSSTASHSALSACKLWGHLELGKWIFEHLQGQSTDTVV